MKKKISLPRNRFLRGKEESEFGRGLVVNLVKFSEHFNNSNLNDCYHVDWWLKNTAVDLTQCDISVQRSVEMFKAVYLKVHGDAAKDLSAMIELWANGATDHLYDLEVPKAWEKTPFNRRILLLKHLGLEIGHGFTGKTWTVEDVTKLRKLTKQICLEIDKCIGITDGDWGQY